MSEKQREWALSGDAHRQHGKTGTSEHKAWMEMRQRCQNPNSTRYHRYGGRGVSVCSRWESFDNFFADMGLKPSPQHSLDRHPNPDGNYEPTNCRWATAFQQARNRSTNRIVEIDGKPMSLAEAVEAHGANYGLVIVRLRRGWDLKRALFDPVRRAG